MQLGQKKKKKNVLYKQNFQDTNCNLLRCWSHLKHLPHFNSRLSAADDVKSNPSNNNIVPNQRQGPEVPHTLFYDGGDHKIIPGSSQASSLCSHKTNKLVYFNSIEFRSGLVSFIDPGVYHKNTSQS